MVLNSKMRVTFTEYSRMKDDIKELQKITAKALRIHGLILSELEISFKELGVWQGGKQDGKQVGNFMLKEVVH